ncbi:MAG: nitrite reductase [Nocardioides sp.]|uniref:nitrite reductase n=1 Tax=Nocardioides sp. TaxID=35761 RepID=UPI0039E4B6DF
MVPESEDLLAPRPAPSGRRRRDLCPGVLRPWPAADGGLVRIRLVGGRVGVASLRRLGAAAAAYGDGDLWLTSRANLQIRGLSAPPAGTDHPIVAEIAAAGLLPSRSHDLVRNIMVSPQTGLAGGYADLRPYAERLDAALRSEAALAALPAKFCFVLDDGRGDLAGRRLDLGLVALAPDRCALLVGNDRPDRGRRRLTRTIRLEEAVDALVRLAQRFLVRRGDGPGAAWHVDELDQPLIAATADPVLSIPHTPAPPYGPIPGGLHLAVPEGRLTPELLTQLLDGLPDGTGHDLTHLVITPWHGVLLPRAEQERQ